jgi:hypothetical protein
MRANEIIRDLLDLLDQIDHASDPSGIDADVTIIHNHNGDDVNRLKQISGILPDFDCDKSYANEPQEKYAEIEAVTIDAGGGMNGPKHPHDIRVKDPSQHPDQQGY